MVWAKVALTGGMLVVLAAFAVGTENQLSTSFLGQTQDCGPSISASWLVPGTPDQATQPGSAATSDERRAAAACSLVIHDSRVLVVTIMGMGGLIALAGWTAIRTRGEAVPRTVTSVHA